MLTYPTNHPGTSLPQAPRTGSFRQAHGVSGDWSGPFVGLSPDTPFRMTRRVVFQRSVFPARGFSPSLAMSGAAADRKLFRPISPGLRPRILPLVPAGY